MKEFVDRVAVVTGGGSGIGRATCLALAERGTRVAVVDRSEAAAHETADLVKTIGPAASVHTVDVSDVAQLEALPNEVLEAHGAVNILINNAGVTSAGSFERESVEDLQWIVNINMWGVVHGCRVFLPHLHEADEAHIVNLSSMVGLVGLPHNVAYSLTKGAVRGFTEGLRAELIRTSIGVTTVFPGSINTNITQHARGAERDRLARMGKNRLAPIVMRPPAAVANGIVKGIERNKARVVVGPDAHMVSLITRFAPGRSGLIGRLTSRVAE
ncbi:MAG: SDR family NAD(P)-dependent oxidoreductase [Microthrixaceae bacterium]|nr:SDR family NAD(P)-dependent oxidoreductase [Microthrixaceae bacterium]